MIKEQIEILLNNNDAEFLDYLVLAITKKPVSSYSGSVLVEVQTKCYNIFQNWIYSYFQDNFEGKDLLRIQNIASEPTTFQKFPDLNEKYNQAYNAFLEYLITL